MRVPAFMLKKLYVPGSLTSEGDGFSFKLKNTLANATLTAPPEIKIDGNVVPEDTVVAILDGKELRAPDVSGDNPLALAKGAEVTMKVAGMEVGGGAHKIAIKSDSKEWGLMEFEVEDKL